jgi:hypothetical protein
MLDILYWLLNELLLSVLAIRFNVLFLGGVNRSWSTDWGLGWSGSGSSTGAGWGAVASRLAMTDYVDGCEDEGDDEEDAADC